MVDLSQSTTPDTPWYPGMLTYPKPDFQHTQYRVIWGCPDTQIRWGTAYEEAACGTTCDEAVCGTVSASGFGAVTQTFPNCKFFDPKILVHFSHHNIFLFNNFEKCAQLMRVNCRNQFHGPHHITCHIGRCQLCLCTSVCRNIFDK